MKIDRRKFLLGTSAVAVSAAIPVTATVTYEHSEVALGYFVARKAINDNLYRQLDGWIACAAYRVRDVN